ncbi:YbaY family lipoprotein [Onishia niordana]|uniref:YbaY family lipoprotein n=1 Tax=Onishia niordana TaxID=2508711 RepID=UPI00109FEA0D|nr:YbaY family lipoprotein [Halomonas niordiana]
MKLKRHLFIAAALTGTLVLAGCDSGDDTEQAAQNETSSQTEQAAQDGASSQTEQATQDGASSQTKQQASRTLQGKLEFSATETPLPEEAEVTVSLKDVAEADDPAVITETTVIPKDGEPVEFALDYDATAATTTASRAYILQATLYDGDGNLRWSTKQRHTVEVGPDAEQEPITLVLEPVTSGPSGDESLQEAQQEMLEPEEDAKAETTPSEASNASLEEIDEKATEMQEPTTSEADTTTAQ